MGGKWKEGAGPQQCLILKSHLFSSLEFPEGKELASQLLFLEYLLRLGTHSSPGRWGLNAHLQVGKLRFNRVCQLLKCTRPQREGRGGRRSLPVHHPQRNVPPSPPTCPWHVPLGPPGRCLCGTQAGISSWEEPPVAQTQARVME